MDDRTPILIGTGQLTQREDDPIAATDPFGMMTASARAAAEDAATGAHTLTTLDTVAVVNIIGWQYANAPRLLAEALGAHPQREIYTTVGGNTPQWMVNETAAQIADGTVRLALIAGAEAIHTLVRARQRGVTLNWTRGGSGAPTVIGDARLGTNDDEMRHGLQMPTNIYPLFENALRAHRGRSITDHQRMLGALCSRMSAVAAHNPYAWFRTARSCDEISTVTADNRMIGFPYPKFMNAIITVDQSAAVLMTSVGHARSLGIPESRWVYLRGCGDAYDHWFISERVNYWSSPAIRAAGRQALTMAGIDIGQVPFIDLYSCFPCAVQLGRDMLGIAENDERPLTITGGLPYHGGPGNNYTLHAIATLLDRLRAAPDAFGLVTGLGWYVTKHSVGIYSATPPARPWHRDDPHRQQATLDAEPHPTIAAEPTGAAEIETYTVLHDRDGVPEKGIVVGRLADGRRFLANTPNDRGILETMMVREAIGTSGRVRSADGFNTFTPD